ncbi:MAG: hypothetical protein H7X86_07070 [Gorillibacterium sp.]|nr:hypothetical protein [Gorillibacterium sp.]
MGDPYEGYLEKQYATEEVVVTPEINRLGLELMGMVTRLFKLYFLAHV